MNNWQIKHCFQFWNLEYPALCTRFKIERRKRFLLFYPGSRVSFWFLITRKSTINKIGSFVDQCRGEQRCIKFIPMPFYSHFCCQGFPTAQCVVIVLQIYSVLSFTMDDEDYERLCVVCFVSGLSGFLACSYEYYKVSISLRRNTEEEFYSPDFCSWRRETIKWPLIFLSASFSSWSCRLKNRHPQ
jgi:hypothetical protein